MLANAIGSLIDVRSPRRALLLAALLCAPLAVLAAPLLVANNQSLAVLQAVHIDGGSIVNSVHEVVSQPPYINQNIGFHTKVYGWTYNTCLIGIFAFLEHATGLSFQSYFFVYATLAKCVSFAFSLGSAVLLLLLARRVFRNGHAAAAATVLGLASYPFLTYVFLIHPDPAGLFFSLGMFLCVHRFLEVRSSRSYLAAVLCFALAVLAKQPVALGIIPLVAAYFLAHRGVEPLPKMFLRRKHWMMALHSAGVGLAALLIVHPFALFDFENFRAAQSYMLHCHAGAAGASRLANARAWIIDCFLRDGMVTIGFAASLLTIIYSAQPALASRRLLRLIGLYNVVYLAWLAWGVSPACEPMYFYPVYPFLALISVETARLFVLRLRAAGEDWKKFAWGAATAGACITILSATAWHLAVATSHAASTLAYAATNQSYVANLVSLAHGNESQNVLYSCSLAIAPKEYAYSVNTFSVDGEIQEGCDKLNLDLIVLDLQQGWRYESELKPADSRAPLPCEYVIPKQYPQYLGIAGLRSASFAKCWTVLKSDFRRLSGGGRDFDENAPCAKIFSRRPIPMLEPFRKPAIEATAATGGASNSR